MNENTEQPGRDYGESVSFGRGFLYGGLFSMTFLVLVVLIWILIS